MYQFRHACNPHTVSAYVNTINKFRLGEDDIHQSVCNALLSVYVPMSELQWYIHKHGIGTVSSHQLFSSLKYDFIRERVKSHVIMMDIRIQPLLI